MTQYALRLPDSLKIAAQRLAKSDNTSLNQLIVTALAEKVSALETADFFTHRAQAHSPQAAQAAWDKVAKVKPEPHEERV